MIVIEKCERSAAEVSSMSAEIQRVGEVKAIERALVTVNVRVRLFGVKR